MNVPPEKLKTIDYKFRALDRNLSEKQREGLPFFVALMEPDD